MKGLGHDSAGDGGPRGVRWGCRCWRKEALAELYVELDIHKHYVYSTVIEEAGREQFAGRGDNDLGAQPAFAASLREEAQGALDACYGWPFVYDALAGRVREIVPPHPQKTKVIAAAKGETERAMPRCWRSCSAWTLLF